MKHSAGSYPETAQKMESCRSRPGGARAQRQPQAGEGRFLPDMTRAQSQLGSPQTKGILGPWEEPQ